MSYDFTFIDDLSSYLPTPGGGGVAAYGGALASALVTMVGNITVKKTNDKNSENQIHEAIEQLYDLKNTLLTLLDRDAEVFKQLAQVWKMPSESVEEKNKKENLEQQTLIEACEVPLQIMGACAKVIVFCDFMLQNGSKNMLSDVGIAALFAKASLESASLTVLINVSSIKDRLQAKDILAKHDLLLSTYSAKAQKIYQECREEIN